MIMGDTTVLDIATATKNIPIAIMRAHDDGRGNQSGIHFIGEYQDMLFIPENLLYCTINEISIRPERISILINYNEWG